MRCRPSRLVILFPSALSSRRCRRHSNSVPPTAKRKKFNAFPLGQIKSPEEYGALTTQRFHIVMADIQILQIEKVTIRGDTCETTGPGSLASVQKLAEGRGAAKRQRNLPTNCARQIVSSRSLGFHSATPNRSDSCSAIVTKT